MIQEYEVSDPGFCAVDHILIIPSIANYLNDLWYFDTQEYHWKQVDMKENERKPSLARHSI